RNDLVTGVQTCALPIWVVADIPAELVGRVERRKRRVPPLPGMSNLEWQSQASHDADRAIRMQHKPKVLTRQPHRPRRILGSQHRSEERRVGKRGGRGWG